MASRGAAMLRPYPYRVLFADSFSDPTPEKGV